MTELPITNFDAAARAPRRHGQARAARWFGVLFSLCLLSGGVNAHAQALPSDSPVTVTVGDDGAVSIDAVALPIGDLLRALATAAHWDLALSAPQSVLQTPVTLQVKNRTQPEVLARLEAMSGLQIEVTGGFLSVHADKAEGEKGDKRGKRKGRMRIKGDDRVVMGQPVTIGPNDTVDDAVAIGAPLRVDGHVRGDAVAVGSSLVLGPTAIVDGDAVSVGGAIEVQPGAQLRGSQVSVPNVMGGFTRFLSHAHKDDWGDHDDWKPNVWWRAFFSVVRTLGLLLLGLLLLTFVPARIATIASTLTARPWMSLLVGVSLLIGLVPACVLLAVTLVGIPLIPLAIALFLVLLWVGATAVASRVGTGLPGSERRGLFVNFALGVLLLGLCDLVPWVGTALLLLLSFVGAGATVLSRLGTRAEPEPPQAPPDAPAAPNDPAPLSSALPG